MTQVNWGLSQGGGFQNALAQGFRVGSQIRQRREEGEQRNALAAYATNPTPEALNGLAQYNPEFVLSERARMQAQQQAQAERDLIGRGAQGDEDAILQLWGVNPDEASRLDTRARARATEGFSYIGQAGLAIDRLPEEQRPQAWDAAIDEGVRMGFDGLAQYRGQYSPQSLQGIVARAGQMQTLIGNRNPSYMAIPEGGTLVNTRDPGAVAQFGAMGGQAPMQQPTQGQGPGAVVSAQDFARHVASMGPEVAARFTVENNIAVSVTTPDEARRLPSGTLILLPDGSEGRVP